MKRELIALVVCAAALSGCAVTVDGTATKAKLPTVSVYGNDGSEEDSFAVSTLSDMAAYWKSKGVDLNHLRYVQWNTSEGDSPLWCDHSVFPQASFCDTGWIGWDKSWLVKTVAIDPAVAAVYMSSAVSSAVMFSKLGDRYSRSEIRNMACLNGAYLSTTPYGSSKTLKHYSMDITAYARGWTSTDPLGECLSL